MIDITYTNGDATNPIGSGKKYIIHVCNDIGKWGAGFVLAISKKWSFPQAKFLVISKAGNSILGSCQFCKVSDEITVINMIAQHGIRSKNNISPIRYDALEKCLKEISEFILYKKLNNISIHAPRIGCGLAGGKWEKIEPLLIKYFSKNNIPIFIYDYKP